MEKLPTVDVYKADKHAIINESDLPAWQKDGWGVEVPGSQPEPETAKKTKRGK